LLKAASIVTRTLSELTEIDFERMQFGFGTAVGDAWGCFVGLCHSCRNAPHSAGRPQQDFRYYELLEESLRTQFDYRYFVLRDEISGRVGAPAVFLRESRPARGLAKGPCAHCSRRFGSYAAIPEGLRMMMIGCAAGEGELDHAGPCLPMRCAR